MLSHVLRRAVAQRGLLTAVVALVAVACTLVGTCTLIVGVTQQRGWSQAFAQVPDADVDVTAFLVDLSSADAGTASQEAEAVVAGVLTGMDPEVEATTTSRLRELDRPAHGVDDQAYLVATTQPDARADLVSGRWPRPGGGPAAETTVPDRAAELLGLAVGDVVVLGRETGLGGEDAAVRLRVVGTFEPRSGVEWQRDPLGGAGFSPAYSDGLTPAPTYGPFLVDEQALLATGSSIAALRVTAHPDQRAADASTLRAAAAGIAAAPGLLQARVDGRARSVRVASSLSGALDHLEAQQTATRSTVLVVLVLGLALSLAAAWMTGRLVATFREGERDLLASLGLSTRQRFLAAATEAALTAVVATLVAVPASAFLHAWLTRRGVLAAAGLAQPPAVTTALVLAVLGTAGALASCLAVGSARPPAVADRSPDRRVRLALDVVLVLVAVAAWWQLRAREAAPAGAVDAVLTVAPVVCLGVLTVLGTRVLPPALARAARGAGRSRSFVLPLAVQQAARRLPGTTTAVLLTAAVAAAVLGIALRTTWEQSQDDQAALRVGTDLTVTADRPVVAADAAAVEAAVGPADADDRGATVLSPVVRRPLTLGRYVGQEGSRPVLVAVDTRASGALLRGRTDPGPTWTAVGQRLAPERQVGGVPVPADGTGLALSGTAPSGVELTAHPTLVLQDRTGLRFSVPATPVRLDADVHQLRWSAPAARDLALVAVRLELDGRHSAGGIGTATGSDVRVDLTVPSTPSTPAGAADEQWQASRLQEHGPIRSLDAALLRSDGAVDLSLHLDVDLTYIEYGGADVLAASFAAPDGVPVAVSKDLAEAVGAGPGTRLAAIVGDTTLALDIEEVVATVPSAPGAVAVLADADTLSRALVHAGRLDPVVDGWWVGAPGPGDEQRLESAGLGPVTSRAGVAAQLSRGPLQAAVPTMLLVLVVLAVAMQVSAVVLLLGSDRRRRATEVARLRALGASRAQAGRAQLVEHLLVVVPLTLVGAAVGAAAAFLVGPHLVRSDVGAAPVPPAVVAWPWGAELVLVSALLVVSTVLVATSGASLARRSDPSRLGNGAA